MSSKEISLGILKAVGVIAAIALALFFLYLIRSIILYIFIALALSLIGRPLMKFFTEKLKLSHTSSAILIILIFVTLLIGFVYISVPLITKQTRNLSLSNLQELRVNMENLLQDINQSLNQFGIRGISENEINRSLSAFNFGNITNAFSNIFGYIGNILLAVFSVFFITFWFLKDKNLFNRFVISLFPEKEEGKISKVITQTKDLLSNYFIGLVLQALIMFTLYFIILLCFGIDNAFIIAMICAILNLIPFLGPLVGGFIFVLLSMSSMYADNLDMESQIIPNTFYILVCYLLAQLVDNFINQPLIYSKSVKSHPLEIFIVILIFGAIFGVPGVILAVPGYTFIRVILKNFFEKSNYVKYNLKNL